MPFSVQVSLAQAMNASSSESNACSNAPKAIKNRGQLAMTQEKSRKMQHMSTSDTEMAVPCEPYHIAGES